MHDVDGKDSEGGHFEIDKILSEFQMLDTELQCLIYTARFGGFVMVLLYF